MNRDDAATPVNRTLFGFFNRGYPTLNVATIRAIEVPPLLIEVPALLSDELPTISLYPIQNDLPRILDIINSQDRPDSFSETFNNWLGQFGHIQAPELQLRRQPSTWASWNDVGRAQMASQLAVPLESLNATRLEGYTHLNIDDDFICGISREIMTHPVYDPAFPQQRFDLLVIRAWLQEHPTNPFTRTPLLPENLVYDELLRERIDLFVSNTLSQSSLNL